MQPLLYLIGCSLVNRLVAGARRLREPKYALGLAATAAYFWFLVFGPLRQQGDLNLARTLSSEYRPLLQALGGLVLLVILAGAWLQPRRRSALRFTEEEIAVLFPAPIGRTALVAYKLAKLQVATVVSVLIFSAISALVSSGRASPLTPVAWWLLLSFVQLAVIGIGFLRDRLGLVAEEPGGARRLGRVGAGAALIVAGLAWIFFASSGVEPPGMSPRAWIDFAGTVLTTGPVGWIVQPFGWLVAPVFEREPLSFLGASLPLVGVIVVLASWVLRSGAAFEEGAVELADQSRKRQESARSRVNRGLPMDLKPRPDAWVLEPAAGRPELGLAWKNLTLLGIWGRPRILIPTLAGAALLGGLVGLWAPFAAAAMLGSTLGSLLVLSLVSGGQLLRIDLRQDAAHLEVLKTLPLSGSQMVRGQVAAPVWVLFVWQVAALVALLFLLIGSAGGRDFLAGGGWVIFAALAVLAPPLNALNFLLANALFLLFPAWYSVDAQQSQAFSRMGQGLIQMLFQAVLMSVILIPCGAFLLAFGYGGVALLDHAAGALLGILPAAALLGAAALFFTSAVGRDFEQFDVVKELR